MSINPVVSLSERRTILFQYFLFLIIIWAAYFTGFQSFGLYEDDYWFIGKPANLNFQGLLQMLRENITNIEGGQGRLIGFTLPQILTFTSFKLGGLEGVYILGSLIIFLNAILVFNFARRILPVFFASLSSILFILFPADTTKPLLIHIFQLQLSLTFVLLALNQYLKDRKALAFILAFCSLLTYENAFLPFLAIPLFKYAFDKKIIQRFLVHITICFLILFMVFFIRKLMGETRVGEMSVFQMGKMAVMSLIIGPAVSLFSFFVAVLEVLVSIKILIWILILSIIIFSIWIAFFGKINTSSERVKNSYSLLSIFNIVIDSEKDFNQIIRFIIASLVMLVFSYLFAFTHFPPVILHGRSTSIHLAGSLAGSILVATLIYLLYYLVQNWKYGILSVHIVVVLLLSILVGRGQLIQGDFIKSWAEQKIFWNEIIDATPDAGKNTIILVKVKDLKEDLKNVETFSWPVPEVYNQIYLLNKEEFPSPKVVVIGDTFTDSLNCDNHGIYFEPVYPFVFENRDKVYLENNNLIYLRYSKNKVSRIDTIFSCDTLRIKTHDNYTDKFNNPKLQPIGRLFIED